MNASNWLVLRYRQLLCAAVLVLGMAALSSAQTADDPVERLRVTLNVCSILPERDEKTKACLADLHSLSDLHKAFLLRDWRHRSANAELAAVDQANRDALAERFRKTLGQVLAGKDGGSIVAALEMLGETATTLQSIGEPLTLTRTLTPVVARLLSVADPAIRLAAARTLGRIDPDLESVLPPLIEMAKSADAAKRIAAAAALGEVMQGTAQPWLAQEFNSVLLPDRQIAVENAVKLLPMAGASAADPSPEVRCRSLKTMALAARLLEQLMPPIQQETRDPREVQPLTQALQNQLMSVNRCLRDKHSEVKVQAMKVLEETARARQRWLQQLGRKLEPGETLEDPLATGLAVALPNLAATLADLDVTVRRATLDVLEVYGPLATAAAPATALALRDPDRFVRWAAVRTLGTIGPAARPAIPALTKLLQDPDLDVRQAAATALHTLDPKGEGLPPKPNQPASAPRSSLPALLQALTHDSVEVRLTALHSIGTMGANARPAIPLLTATLRDPDPRVRLAAVQALGAIGPATKTVAAALRQALKDDDGEVRKAAGEALLSLELEP